MRQKRVDYRASTGPHRWRVDKVDAMDKMFKKASSFNQDLGWCVGDAGGLHSRRHAVRGDVVRRRVAVAVASGDLPADLQADLQAVAARGARAAPTTPTGSTTRATRASRGATIASSPPRSRSGARGASARTASRRWKPARRRAASARRRARTSTPYPEPVLPSPGVSPSYNVL